MCIEFISESNFLVDCFVFYLKKAEYFWQVMLSVNHSDRAYLNTHINLYYTDILHETWSSYKHVIFTFMRVRIHVLPYA